MTEAIVQSVVLAALPPWLAIAILAVAVVAGVAYEVVRARRVLDAEPDGGDDHAPGSDGEPSSPPPAGAAPESPGAPASPGVPASSGELELDAETVDGVVAETVQSLQAQLRGEHLDEGDADRLTSVVAAEVAAVVGESRGLSEQGRSQLEDALRTEVARTLAARQPV